MSKAAIEYIKVNYSAKSARAIIKHGSTKCHQAYLMNVKQGEGASYIANELDIHINSTSAAIAAGEEIEQKGREVRVKADQLIALGAAK
jgi:hypothetical protein